MAVNSFKCPQCGKFTKHIQISFREFSALDNRGIGHGIFATFCDFTGLSKFVVNDVAGLRYYKCCECGRPTSRKLDGTEAIGE